MLTRTDLGKAQYDIVKKKTLQSVMTPTEKYIKGKKYIFFLNRHAMEIHNKHMVFSNWTEKVL